MRDRTTARKQRLYLWPPCHCELYAHLFHSSLFVHLLVAFPSQYFPLYNVDGGELGRVGNFLVSIALALRLLVK